ncbi:amidohydrolase ytcJ [Mycobacteroides abscessus subsp. abscessus]|nr:amidohydrolase ytcJ [Mycobacteroides abscessus subsp. abscessus]
MRVCGPCRTVGMSSTGHLLRSLRDPRTGETLDARIRDARVRLAPPGALTPEPGETVLDAEGRWLIPGLWDRHVHVDQWAQARTRLDLTAADSAEQALQTVRAHLTQRERAEDLEPGEALFGFGYRSSVWPRQPTVAELDAVTGPRPVVLISGDMHNGWLNTTALRMLGAPETDGALSENRWFPLYSQLERHMPDTARLIPQTLRDAASRGVVGLVDLEFAANHRVWPERLAAGLNLLRVRTGVYQEHLEEVVEAGLRTGDRLCSPEQDPEGLLRMGPLKIISDGSLGTRTAHCCSPYLGSPDPTRPSGVQNESPQRLRRLLGAAHEAGLQVALHAIGDAAVRHALDAYAATGARGSIEHVQLMRREDLPRMAALGITASVQPAHLLDDRDVTDVLWADRAERSFMLASMLAAGIPLAFGSDAPVSPLDPWLEMAAAVHRSGDARPAWHPEEAIGAQAALRASTGGRLVPADGDVADLAIVEDNPLAPAANTAETGARLRGMRVWATFLAGRPTHGPTAC